MAKKSKKKVDLPTYRGIQSNVMVDGKQNIDLGELLKENIKAAGKGVYDLLTSTNRWASGPLRGKNGR